MNKRGKVTGLLIYSDNHPHGKHVSQIDVVKDEGICGDRHAKGGVRQISLLDTGLKEWMEKQSKQGICFHKFKENIAIEGIDFAELSPGTMLTIGSAKLIISSWQKRCYRSECTIYNIGKDCRAPASCLFAAVLQSGTISENQQVFISQD